METPVALPVCFWLDSVAPRLERTGSGFIERLEEPMTEVTEEQLAAAKKGLQNPKTPEDFARLAQWRYQGYGQDELLALKDWVAHLITQRGHTLDLDARMAEIERRLALLAG